MAALLTNIPAMIYYPVPAHRQEMFLHFGGANFDLPATIFLPAA
jgi:hypothetical protein